MNISKYYTLEDVMGKSLQENFSRIGKHILDPIGVRFGALEFNPLQAYLGFGMISFKVVGFSSDIIRDYIEHNLIHTEVDIEGDWVIVSCKPGA